MPIRAGERDSLPYGAWTSLVFTAAAYGDRTLLITFWPVCKESPQGTEDQGFWKITVASASEASIFHRLEIWRV